MAAHLTVTALSLLIAGALGACPDGWLRAGGYCYWLAPSTVSFQDAQGICSSKEASLVSLATRQDLNATLAVAASVSGVKQTWSCLRYDPSFQAWVWLDGTPYAANTVPWWGDKEPTLHSRGDTTEACAALDSAASRLHRVACTDRASPVCRRSAYKRELCDEEDGWRAMGSSCYKTFADQQSYWDADHTCRHHSATLLPLPFSDTIKSVIQQSVVCDTSDNDVWISSPNATRMTSSTQSTGSTAVPQPAVCNYVSVQYNLLLVTDTCLQERKFICVKRQGSCAEGWTGQDGRCYKAFVSKLPWFSAFSQCLHLHADLLTISDSTEQQFVQSQMIAGKFPQQFWMGISDADKDGQLSHSDDTPVSMYYTAWSQGFPVDTPNAVDCAFITLGENNATWSDGYCFTSRPYVCEMSVSDDINNDTNTGFCDVGWRLQGNWCYLLGANKNYTEARDFCRASDSTLAIARNNIDLSAVAAIIPDASLAWIGLKKDDLSGQFVWEDSGTTLSSRTNWLPGEPNNAGGGEDCVQMVGAAQRNMAGAWNDNNCSKPTDFICQRNNRMSRTTPRPSSLLTVSWSARCGEGWLLSPVLSACYLLVTDVTVPWAAARAQCRRHSGDLVSVTSHREQTLMEAMVQSAGLAEGGEAWSGVWIGATDNTEEGG
ncbi:macrophage mannose receptor 1-like, partial [Littorina saxatilis]|uniref:macrophage mannose receptor 1-like n=1 Tax=Littorina saxatilis TaxID=31220 RepID=UPI0038B4A713